MKTEIPETVILDTQKRAYEHVDNVKRLQGITRQKEKNCIWKAVCQKNK